MIRNKKISLDGGARPATLRRFFPVILTIILLVPVQNVSAAVQSTSGTAQLSNTLTYGNTAYSVDYAYPSQAQVGTNLTIAITLHVVSMTGLIEYARGYAIVARVFIGAQRVLNGSIVSSSNSPNLYPGSTWGPNNVTIPLTAENTGLAKGESANATVSISLADLIWYGLPLKTFASEPSMQGEAGGLVIQNAVASTSTSTTVQPAGQTYLPYALLASGAVLMLAAVVLPRVTRSPQANQK